MILHKLRMKNFRQFIGTQELVFVFEHEEKKENITVIFGENGRGKTGIYRAIMFCLYGEHRLSQDEHVEEKELHLVNRVALQNVLETGKNEPVECSVELEFSHEGSVFNLQRTLLGMFDGDTIMQERGPVRLLERTPDGNTKPPIEDPTEISRKINTILDQRVREYFLFDGEKIERLTKASPEQRKEISKGLRNLLNIDTLETARKATARLQKSLDSQLEKSSTGEYAKVLRQIKENSELRTQLEERLKQLEDEIEAAVTEKRQVDKDFEKIKEVSDLITERNTLEAEEQELQERLNVRLSEMRTRSGKVSLLLMGKTITRVFSHVDRRKQKGEIPSEIRKDLIEKILSEHKCICGRPVEVGTDAFDQIISWRNRATEVVIEDFMLELWRLLGSVKDHFDDTVRNAETLLIQYANTKNDIEHVRIRIKEISDKIGASEREDASKLQKHRQKLEQKITKLNAERLKSAEELDTLKEDYERLQIKRKEEEWKEGVKNELSKRASLALDTYNALCAVYDEFADEIKHVISQNATEFFQQFIDQQGSETLRQIIVNDDYSLQILDRWGKPFLADISAGQRQIMSISFIAALAKAAAKDATFEMPFFMDTPFGRLSYEHRRNLIENVPHFAHQWILLATDTEFRRQEARLLRQTNLWGRFYLLKGEGAGVTKIEACDIENAFAYLKEVEDERL